MVTWTSTRTIFFWCLGMSVDLKLLIFHWRIRGLPYWNNFWIDDKRYLILVRGYSCDLVLFVTICDSWRLYYIYKLFLYFSRSVLFPSKDYFYSWMDCLFENNLSFTWAASTSLRNIYMSVRDLPGLFRDAFINAVPNASNIFCSLRARHLSWRWL